MLWLHVGPPKTGSSALQAYLRERRNDLSATGVFYGWEDSQEKPDAAWREVGNGVELGWWLGMGRPPRRFSPEAFAEGFRRTFVSPDHPISLLSSELIAGAELDRLRALRDGPARGLEIGVLGVARDVYGHALSSWMHAIKRTGGTRDFAAYCRKGYGGPGAEAFLNLAEVFGRDRVRLVHYDSIKEDIVAGVFAALGVAAPQPTRSRVANRGLSPVELQVAMACNRLHQNRDGLSMVISRHITTKRPQKGAEFPFNAPAAEILQSRFAKDVVWINTSFFEGREVLRIAAEQEAQMAGLPDIAPDQVWNEVVEALLQELQERAGETRRAQAEALALRAMEKRRRGEDNAALRLASSALELDAENEDAKALLERLAAPQA